MTEHPSRTAWPAMEAPRVPTRVQRYATVALYVAVTLNMLLSVLIFAYVVVLKDSRDTETQRIQQQIRTSICDLLDQLPAGGLLERPRAKYRCGPGIPLADLTPQERAQVGADAPAATPTAAPSRAAPPAPSSTPVPPAPRATTSPPAAAPAPSPPPTPAPTPMPEPLAPLTKPVCALVGVCPQGAIP